MAINFRSNTIIRNLSIGPLSGGGNGGGGGGSSEPSYLAVGAKNANSATGKIYVYDISNYSLSPTQVVPTDISTSDEFGIAIAGNSTLLAIGAHLHSGYAGAVYVYDPSNLSSSPTKLTPASSNDQFGQTVAVTADLLVVGASGDDTVSGNAGAIYVYDTSNLSNNPTKITAYDGAGNDRFGTSVACSTNYIVTGAPSFSGAGSAYVYDATNLSASPTKLTAPDGQAVEFGNYVAVSDNYIAIGDAYNNSNAGAVYVYDASNLSTSPTKLVPPSGQPEFGWSIDISGNSMVIGAPNDNASSTSEAGAAYVYDLTNLSSSPTKLTAYDASTRDYYGKAVTFVGNSLVIGSPGDDDNGSSSGAAYVYDATNLSATPTKLIGAAGDMFGQDIELG